jgi:hypothetical protein
MIYIKDNIYEGDLVSVEVFVKAGDLVLEINYKKNPMTTLQFKQAIAEFQTIQVMINHNLNLK